MKEEFLAYMLNNMTLAEKIGQMIMIDYRKTTEMTVELEEILTKYNPGGFILFKGNVDSIDNFRQAEANYRKVQKFLSDIKSATNIQGIMSVDQEGGRVQRLDKRVGFKSYAPMGKIGKTESVELAFALGAEMGRELKGIGIDMDMAPVLDIFSNPKNTAIGDRAFGKTPEIVTDMALSYADGLKKEGIIPIGKHFPGHGGTLKDSHVSLPFVDKTLKELKEFELKPFEAAVERKLSGIMVGHLAVPKVTGNNIPASLSEKMINGILRTDMGYDGLVLTDSLQMKGLKDKTVTNTMDNSSDIPALTDEDICLRCVQAGNDIVLMPHNINEAFDTIRKNVDNGVITEDRINTSVYRILSTKFDFGLLDSEYTNYKASQKRGNRISSTEFDFSLLEGDYNNYKESQSRGYKR